MRPLWRRRSWADEREPDRGALERVCHRIIVLVSVLVPRSRRSGWREEWESEVWHHLHTHGQGSVALPGAALLVRCLGAFPHALWEVDATQPLTRTSGMEQTLWRRAVSRPCCWDSFLCSLSGSQASASIAFSPKA